MKLVMVKKLMSDWETSGVHVTRAVIFKLTEYCKIGYSNDYLAHTPLNMQDLIGHHIYQGILG